MTLKVRRNVVLVWASLTVLSMLAAYFFIHFLDREYHGFVAGVVASMLEALGVRSEAEGNVVAYTVEERWTAVRIGWECSGGLSIIVYTGLVSGLPGVKLKKRVLGLTLGYAAIFLGNLTRIVLILYLNQLFPNLSYMLLHDLFGRPLSFLWMTVVWFAWFYHALIKAPEVKDSSAQ
ncbi:MAG: hypothetical protein AYL31_001170 [Candidatus Bathyarchaeota archaeon B26-1]|nr:MAG: hypothetical protein AYL31_001170 [Candidatus Bathyarchaeota archaeon B26-1]